MANQTPENQESEVTQQPAPEPTEAELMDQRMAEALKHLDGTANQEDNPETSQDDAEQAQTENEGEASSQDENATESESEPQEQPDERPVKQALKEKEEQRLKAQYEQELADYQQRLARYQRLEEIKKQNPLAYLEESGIKLDDLTNYIVNEGVKEPTVADLQRELQEYKQQMVQQQQFQQQELIRQQFRENINKYISDKQDEYKVINELGLGEEVYDRIAESAQTARSDADLLSIEAATKQVNDEFKNLYQELHRIFGNAQPAQNTSQPVKTEAQPRQPAQQQPQSTGATLTNDFDSFPVDKVDTSQMTDAELMEYRLAQAAKLFEKK